MWSVGNQRNHNNESTIEIWEIIHGRRRKSAKTFEHPNSDIGNVQSQWTYYNKGDYFVKIETHWLGRRKSIKAIRNVNSELGSVQNQRRFVESSILFVKIETRSLRCRKSMKTIWNLNFACKFYENVWNPAFPSISIKTHCLGHWKSAKTFENLNYDIGNVQSRSKDVKRQKIYEHL